MRWRRWGGLRLLGDANKVDWGCQVVVTKSTWFGGGGGVVVKAVAMVGFWVYEGEWELERERELGFWVSKVNERDREIQCFWQKWKSPKKKKKNEGRFRKRREFRRSIAALQPTAITKQKHCNKESLLRRSYKHRYRSNISVFFSTAAIVSTENDMFIATGFWSAANTHILWRFYVLQLSDAAKDYTYSSGPKNAAIDPMYNGGPKKRSNMRHIAAFFALTTKKPL